MTGDLKEAVTLAAKEARPGETVLFSPACASFDMFRNYEERGNLFIKLIEGTTDHGLRTTDRWSKSYVE